MKNKERSHLVVSLILAWCIAAAVFAGVVAVQLNMGWLNCDRLQRTISSTGFAHQMIAQLKEELEDLLDQNAVPVSVLDDIWDEEELYRTYYQHSQAALLEGAADGTDSYGFDGRLEEAVREYLRENGVEDAEAAGIPLDQMLKDASAIYDSYMYSSFLSGFYSLSHKLAGLCWIVAAACGVAVVASFVALWCMHHYKHHALQYVAGGFLAGILLQIPFIVTMGNGNWISEAGVGPDYYRNLAKDFVQQGLSQGLMILAAEAFLFLLLFMWMRDRRKKE